eukprot:9634598-Lingulodinium_polyedra.AAC.1
MPATAHWAASQTSSHSSPRLMSTNAPARKAMAGAADFWQSHQAPRSSAPPAAVARSSTRRQHQLTKAQSASGALAAKGLGARPSTRCPTARATASVSPPATLHLKASHDAGTPTKRPAAAARGGPFQRTARAPSVAPSGRVQLVGA